jgi:hypothetical protein
MSIEVNRPGESKDSLEYGDGTAINELGCISDERAARAGERVDVSSSSPCILLTSTARCKNVVSDDLEFIDGPRTNLLND